MRGQVAVDFEKGNPLHTLKLESVWLSLAQHFSRVYKLNFSHI